MAHRYWLPDPGPGAVLVPPSVRFPRVAAVAGGHLNRPRPWFLKSGTNQAIPTSWYADGARQVRATLSGRATPYENTDAVTGLAAQPANLLLSFSTRSRSRTATRAARRATAAPGISLPW